MIELPRHATTLRSDLRIKILGLGSAGANALDRIQLDGAEAFELVAINTDAQSLTGSVAGEKLQIGASITRGLGAGGDPDLGHQAAQESAAEIRALINGADMIFLCVGLGGGTGSGAAPLIASYAREQNALLVVFATLPFSFEGKRRMGQAQEALTALQELADVVICFENDRMGDAVSPRAAIQEAFAVADQTISQSVRAIALMVGRRGLLHVGFDELATALRRQSSRCVFGFGEAEGDNRAHVALERALKSTLMDRGRMLTDAHHVLVNVAGGPDLTLNEVQILMEEFNRYISDHTQILFGTAVDPRMGDRLAVTILSSLEADPAAAAAPMLTMAVRRIEPEPPAAVEPAPREVSVSLELPAESLGANPEESIAPESDPVLVPVAVTRPQPRPTAAQAVTAKREVRQEQMQFEPVTRGRFEKSEPTIVDGQDLDVPTFLRRNVRTK